MTKRAKQPTGKPPLPPKLPEPSFDQQKTSIFDSGKHPKEIRVDSGPVPKQAPLQQSGPLKMVSMKTPDHVSGEHKPHKVHQVKMRAISEVTPLKHAQPQNLGYLAPPRDASEVRGRHVRDYVIWGCLSLILASAIALAVWFLGK